MFSPKDAELVILKAYVGKVVDISLEALELSSRQEDQSAIRATHEHLP